MKTLKPFQEIGARFLAERKWAFLGDEPGCGKTLTSICAADMVGARDVLVITKASLLYNWQAEFEDALLGGAVVHVTNDQIPKGRVIISYNRALTVANSAAYKPDVLILDEAHALKNPLSERTLAILGENGMARRANHTWALSGTPFRVDPCDIAPFGVLASANDVNAPHTYYKWRRAFAKTARVPIGKDHFGRARLTEAVVGVKNTQALRAVMQPWFLRRTKAQVLPELPACTWRRLVVDVTPNREFEAALEGLEGEALLAKARQYKSETALVGIEKATAWAAGYDFDREDKVILFAHHLAVLDRLEFLVNKSAGAGSWIRIDGSTSSAERQARVQKFQSDPDVKFAVLSMQAACEGVTLTASSTAIIIEPSYVPADNLQAAGRCDRIGQTQPVTAYLVTANSKVDKAINKALVQRLTMLKDIG